MKITTQSQSNIRSAKIHLMNSIRPARMTQRQKQQQKQQQQQQQIKPSRKKRIINKQNHLSQHDTEKIMPSINDDQFIDPLINKNNLNRLLEQNGYNLDKNRLFTIWQYLVGEYADYIADKAYKITHVQEAAMYKIIEHAAQFAFGVMHNNLSPGFYWQPTSTKMILCYDPKRELEDLKKVTPLTVILKPSHKKNLSSHHDGLMAFYPIIQQLKLAHMFDDFNQTFLQQNHDYENLLDEETKHYFKELQTLNTAEYQWWTTLSRAHLAATGEADFKILFAAFRYFLTQLKILDINTNRYLPATCSFPENRNMLVLLDRALFIIKNAACPEEQLFYINDCDLGPEGAILAMRQSGYQLITKEMKLTPKQIMMPVDFYGFDIIEDDGNNLSLPTSTPILSYDLPSKNNNQEALNDFNFSKNSRNFDFKSYYFRIIGHEKNTFQFATYKELYQLVTQFCSQYNVLKNSDLAAMLERIAYSTIGEKALASHTDPIEDLQELLSLVKDDLKPFTDTIETPAIILFYSRYMYLFYLKYHSKDITAYQNITISEISSMLRLALKEEFNQVQHTLFNSDFGLDLIKIYPAIAPDIFNLYFKRQETKQFKDPKPQNIINLCILLIYFKNHAESIFKKNPHYINQFIRFASLLHEVDLLNDDIPFMAEIESLVYFEKSVFTQNLKKLAEAFSTLPSPILDLLFKILHTINIKESYALPTFLELYALIDQIKKDDALMAVDSRISEREYELKLTEIIQSMLPHTRIGCAPVSKKLEAFVTFIKNAAKNVVTEEGVKQVIEQTRDFLDEKLTNDVLGFVKTINQPTSSIEEVLLKAKELEASIKKKLANPLNRFLADQFLSATIKLETIAGASNPEKLQQKIPYLNTFKAYIHTGSMTSLLEDVLNEKANNEITRKIAALYLGKDLSIKLKNYILSHLPSITHYQNQSIDDALTHYYALFQALDNLLMSLFNALSIIDTSAARQDMASLFLTYQSALPLSLHVELLTGLMQFSKVTAESYLRKVYATLNELEKKDLQYNALDKVTTEKSMEVHPLSHQIKTLCDSIHLLSNQHDIKIEDKNYLLDIFIEQTLHLDSHFPLSAILKLTQIENIIEEEKHALFLHIAKLLTHQKVEKEKDERESIQQLIHTLFNILSESNEKNTAIKLINLIFTHCAPLNSIEIPIYLKILSTFLDNRSSIPIYFQIIHGSLNCDEEKGCSIQDIQKLLDLLNAKPAFIQKISVLCPFKPMLPLHDLLAVLNMDEKNANLYLERFDYDPLFVRHLEGELISAKIIENQYHSDNSVRAVQKIRNILKRSALTDDQQFNLLQQFTYINAIAYDYKIMSPDHLTAKTLIDFSRDELQRKFSELTASLQSFSTPLDKVSKELQVIAVLREILCRTTGIVPYPEQILAVLLALYYPQNLLLQIQTGEGKSLTSALLAVMQWTKRHTVDICTANQDLTTRNYQDFSNFYHFLKIPCGLITSDSESNKYCIGGINYASVSDMSLYRASMKLENQSLRKINDAKLPVSLILDESDYTILDDRTLNNYSTNNATDPYDNPFAFIYPLINEFIDHPDFIQNETHQKIWTSQEDIRKLREYLDVSDKDNGSRLNDQQKMLLKENVTDMQLSVWLDAACYAKLQVERTHFVIQQQKRNGTIIDVAVPLIMGNPQHSSTCMYGEQQFLHARLQKHMKVQYPERVFNFPIDAETPVVASESAQAFVEYYKKNGRIIAFSGTPGTIEEIEEQKKDFNFTAFKLPPHIKGKRTYLPTQFKKLNGCYAGVIYELLHHKALKSGKETKHPMLVFCQDGNHVKKLYEELANEFKKHHKTYTIQLVTGEETEQERKKIIKMAGKSNTVTIATPLLARGTHIEANHLCVVQTFVSSARDQRQIIGRCARNGNNGTYVAIYDTHQLSEQFGLALPVNKHKGLNQISLLQKQIAEETALERQYIIKAAKIKQTIIKEFHRWYKYIISNTATESNELKNKLLQLRSALLYTLTQQWELLLDQSNSKKYPNHYIRRNEQGILEQEALDHCLTQFKQDALNAWHECKNEHLLKLVAWIPNHLQKLSSDELFESNPLPTENASPRGLHEKLLPAKTSLADAMLADISYLRFAEKEITEPMRTKLTQHAEYTVLQKENARMIITRLNASFAWYKRKSWDFYLERQVIKNAVCQILEEIEKNPEISLKKLKNLLICHKATLQNTFTFSLGHTSALRVINQTLQQLEKQSVEPPVFNAKLYPVKTIESKPLQTMSSLKTMAPILEPKPYLPPHASSLCFFGGNELPKKQDIVPCNGWIRRRV